MCRETLRGALGAIALAGIGLVAAAAGAADFTWDGEDPSDLWVDGVNWVGDGAPPLDLAGDGLIFGPTGGVDQSPDAGADDYVNIGSLSFTGADASYTLIGTGSLSFVDGAAITNDSAFLQTINIDLVGNGSSLVLDALLGDLVIGGAIDLSDSGGVELIVQGDFNTTISGIISGVGASVTMDGDGVLTLSGANTYSGNTTLNSGTIILGNDDALGTGLLVIGGDATIESDDDARTIDNDFVLSAELTIAGSNDLTLDGRLLGLSSLVLDAAATVTLNGANTYQGGTTIMQGTIVAGNDLAFGSGSVTLGGDAAIQSDDDARTLANKFDLGTSILTINGANDLELTNTIIGDGSLVLDGALALTLSGESTFTGGTTLNQGTLVLGNNSALGTGMLTLGGDAAIQSNNDARVVANDIDNGGNILTVDGANDLTLTGVISGAGTLMLDGGVALSLTGDNTYSGGTFVTDGSLLLGSDTALGTGDLTLGTDTTIESLASTVDIGNDIDVGASTLTIGGSLDLTLSGQIMGAGGLTVTTSGMLTLTGDSVYTGPTEVNSGATLMLDGSIDGLLNVNDGGTLAGNGSMVGDLTINDGGTFSPGNSVGTFTVDGNYVQEDGSTYFVELNTINGESDMLVVSGTAVLEAGSQIDVDLVSSDYIVSGESFAIITADLGVTDNGVDVISDTATLTFELIVDPDFMDGDTVYALEAYRAPNAYQAAAMGRNNMAIGSGLDSLVPIANADPTGAVAGLLGTLDMLDETSYNTTLTQMSPESYYTTATTGAANTLLFETQLVDYLAERRSGIEIWSRSMRRGPPRGGLAYAGADRAILAAALAQAEDDTAESNTVDPSDPDALAKTEDRWGSYALFQGIWGDVDTSGSRTGFDANSVGGQLGFDYRFARNFIAGMAFSYLYTDTDLKNDAGDVETDSGRLGPYMSLSKGNWYFDGSVSFGYHRSDSNRKIPALNATASASYNAWDVSAYGGTGYNMDLGNSMYLTPNLAFAYSHFDFDDFTESGAGAADLSVESRTSDSLLSRLGVSLTGVLDWGIVMLPSVFGGWEHEFLDPEDISASFAAGGTPFLITTGGGTDDLGYIGGGVDFLVSPTVLGFVRFERKFSNAGDTSVLGVGLSLTF